MISSVTVFRYSTPSYSYETFAISINRQQATAHLAAEVPHKFSFTIFYLARDSPLVHERISDIPGVALGFTMFHQFFGLPPPRFFSHSTVKHDPHPQATSISPSHPPSLLTPHGTAVGSSRLPGQHGHPHSPSSSSGNPGGQRSQKRVTPLKKDQDRAVRRILPASRFSQSSRIVPQKQPSSFPMVAQCPV